MDWGLQANIGSINKNPESNDYSILLLQNKYSRPGPGQAYQKTRTVKLPCLCSFRPRVAVGDRVIVQGVFEPSTNPRFDFMMKITHIGVVPKEEQE